jgi:hypothetical protein
VDNFWVIVRGASVGDFGHHFSGSRAAVYLKNLGKAVLLLEVKQLSLA